MILQLLILLLLIHCVITDLKTRTVSNRIIWLIIILSLPLIYSNISNITLLHWGWIVLLLIDFSTNQIGEGDVKALIPISLSLSISELYIFLMVLVVVFLVILMKYGENSPMFLAIAPAYAFSSIIDFSTGS